MTKEIIDAVSALEKEKGIDGEILLTALEDALLAATRRRPARPSMRRSSWTATTATSGCSPSPCRRRSCSTTRA